MKLAVLRELYPRAFIEMRTEGLERCTGNKDNCNLERVVKRKSIQESGEYSQGVDCIGVRWDATVTFPLSNHPGTRDYVRALG